MPVVVRNLSWLPLSSSFLHPLKSEIRFSCKIAPTESDQDPLVPSLEYISLSFSEGCSIVTVFVRHLQAPTLSQATLPVFPPNRILYFCPVHERLRLDLDESLCLTAPKTIWGRSNDGYIWLIKSPPFKNLIMMIIHLKSSHHLITCLFKINARKSSHLPGHKCGPM